MKNNKWYMTRSVNMEKRHAPITKNKILHASCQLKMTVWTTLHGGVSYVDLYSRNSVLQLKNLSMLPVMEIIIGSVLFKAFMKGSQKSKIQKLTNNSKLRIRRTEIKSVLGKFSSEKPCHNSPGTPIERLSLNTTVMLASAEFIVLTLEI